MPADHFIRDLKEAAIGTIRAFDSQLFADAANPFIRASGSVAGFAGLPTLETAGINILPAPEKRSKQLYLGCWWRTVRDREVGCFRNGRSLRPRLLLAAAALVKHFHAAII